MLTSVKKAYERNAFEAAGQVCPVEKSTVDVYLQIFSNCYSFDMGCKMTGSPGVLKLVEQLKTLIVCGAPKRFCGLIIQHVGRKIEY
jgi:hypothetical protein